MGLTLQHTTVYAVPPSESCKTGWSTGGTNSQVSFTRSISPNQASAVRKNKIMSGDAAQKHVLYGTCNSLVSLLSRYGTCALPPDVSAFMTLPRALRLLLIWAPSWEEDDKKSSSTEGEWRRVCGGRGGKGGGVQDSLIPPSVRKATVAN